MNNLPSKNILVTGATGFIGSHLCEELLKLRANIIAIDYKFNRSSYFFSQKLDKKTHIVEGDICHFRKISQLVKRYKIDYIFHLAAQPLVEVAYQKPKQTLNNNILGTINILESARKYPKIKGVVVASSDKAYGKLKRGQYKETDPLKGDHPYEVSKSSSDLITSAYFQTYKIPTVVTRFGNVYGEGDLHFSRIIPGIIKSLINNEILEIRSDGRFRRDYIYVKDVASGYLILADNVNKIKGEAFNFGSRESLSVLQLIHLIEKSLGKKIKYKILNTAQNEIPYQSLNFAKIQKKLGWKPKNTIAGTIKKIYHWYEGALSSLSLKAL